MGNSYMNSPEHDVEHVPLTLAGLQTPDALVALGALAARALLERNQICFFLAKDGEIRLATIFEVHLDMQPEQEAISHLATLGYDDERLAVYLSGRDARLAASKLEFQALVANCRG
jgi:hypothetical protein